jgi:hypothetical protein
MRFMPPPGNKAKKRWLQFSLRTLLAFTTLAAGLALIRAEIAIL